MKQQSLVNTEYISPGDCGLYCPYWISSIYVSNISYLRAYWISERRERGCSRRGNCVMIINNSQVFQLRLRVSFLHNVLCKHVDKIVPSLTHASSMPRCLIITKNANPISATPGFDPTTSCTHINCATALPLDQTHSLQIWVYCEVDYVCVLYDDVNC